MKLVISDKAYDVFCKLAFILPLLSVAILSLGELYGFDGNVWGAGICNILFAFVEGIIKAAKNGWNNDSSLDI